MTINVLEDIHQNCNFNSYFESVDRYLCKSTASKNGIYLYLTLQKIPTIKQKEQYGNQWFLDDEPCFLDALFQAKKVLYWALEGKLVSL